MGTLAVRQAQHRLTIETSGRGFTDITGGVAAWLGGAFGMEMPEPLSNAHRWLARVQARPSWNA